MEWQGLSEELTTGWLDKLVAYAMLGNNDIGRFSIVLELLSEVLYMYPQQVSGINVCVSPNLG